MSNEQRFQTSEPLAAMPAAARVERENVAVGASRGPWAARLQRAGTVLSWAGAVVVALVVLLLAAVVVLPRAMGWQGMIVLSGSMEPALKVGGLAFMDPISPEQGASIEPGEIVTYRHERGPGLVSHRVVEVLETEQGLAFITRGDANEENDTSPVAASRVVGKVRFHVPYLGTLVRKLQHRTTYYVLLGIPAGLLIATELWSIAGELRRGRREGSSTGEATS